MTYADKHRWPNVILQSVVVYAKFHCWCLEPDCGLAWRASFLPNVRRDVLLCATTAFCYIILDSFLQHCIMGVLQLTRDNNICTVIDWKAKSHAPEFQSQSPVYEGRVVDTSNDVTKRNMRTQNTLSFFLFSVCSLICTAEGDCAVLQWKRSKRSLIYIFGCTNQWTSIN